jgi:hypothetical protein
MSYLQTTIVKSYNGFNFGPYSSSRITVTPIRDRANRTTIYNKYTLVVTDWIQANMLGDGDTGDAMYALRQQLTTQGAPLSITAFGFGDITINDPATAVGNPIVGAVGGAASPRDVAFGPIPEPLECMPMGTNQAWQITWRCSFVIPDCTDAVYFGTPLAFNYGVNFAIDRRGYTVRTISGYCVIPNNRQNQLIDAVWTQTRGITDAPDSPYWDKIYDYLAIPEIPNFTRETVRSLSEDMTTLNFTITDTQLPNSSFVPFCSEWSATQNVNLSMKSAQLGKAVNTLHATYTMTPKAPKSAAYIHFQSLLANRKLGIANITSPIAGGVFIPVSFTVDDQLNGDQCGFSSTYTFTCTLDQVMIGANMFSGIAWVAPNVPQSSVATWYQWADTVGATTLGVRGVAQVIFEPGQVLIQDLCKNVAPFA